MRPGIELWVLLALVVAALVVSGWNPYDRPTWLLEVLPVLVGVPLLAATRSRFPLTPLLYRLLFLHALILILGGHYTYARVPLGEWAQDAFDLARNHYDRLGHFAQGFVPAILAREILLRTSRLRRGGWLSFVVVSVCLAFSASYELAEWLAAVIGGAAADAFLGTQGDVWDTQWDMFLALLGAITSQLLLSRWHDAQLRRLGIPRRMWIMVAGPYRSGAASEAERADNLRDMNRLAWAVVQRGHVPVIGVNLALPVIEAAGQEHYDELMTPLSLAAAERCDAVLRVGGPSPGADEEVERIRRHGGPVYTSVEQIPVRRGEW